MTARYRRVLLKASGEALMGEQHFGIDVSVVDRIAADIAEARAMGVEVGVVIGGGNIFRGVAVASKGGDRVTLGGSCQFLFNVPVPVSTTARLDLVSGQRLPLAVDGVVLMADNLVLGPGPQAHVVVPDLASPVVLFRHPGGLGLRHKQKLTVDGRAAAERERAASRARSRTPWRRRG